MPSTQYHCPSINCSDPIKQSQGGAMQHACLYGHETKLIQACFNTVNCLEMDTTFDSTETLQNHLRYTHGVDMGEFLKSHPREVSPGLPYVLAHIVMVLCLCSLGLCLQGVIN